MTRLVVTTTERSLFSASAPSADAITRAFQAARIGLDGSHWVGPGPRVTRRAPLDLALGPVLGGNRPYETTATWVYEWPDAIRVVPRQALLDSVARQLRAQSEDWETPTAYAYDPGVHGTLDWWQSGRAGVTQTRDEFPTEFGRFDAPENPTGPTTRETHPSTAGEVARDVANAAEHGTKAGTDLLFPVALGAAVVVGLVLAWKLGTSGAVPVVVNVPPQPAPWATWQAFDAGPVHRGRAMASRRR